MSKEAGQNNWDGEMCPKADASHDQMSEGQTFPEADHPTQRYEMGTWHQKDAQSPLLAKEC